MVSADQGRVDHEILVLTVSGEHLEDALPYAGLGPTREAGVDAFPLAISFGQIVPVGA